MSDDFNQNNPDFQSESGTGSPENQPYPQTSWQSETPQGTDADYPSEQPADQEQDYRQQAEYQQPAEQQMEYQPQSADQPSQPKPKMGLIIGVAAAIVAIAAAVLLILSNTSVKAPTDPKEYIAFAMENTRLTLEKEQGMQTNLSDLSAIATRAQANPSRMNYYFGLTGDASLFGTLGLTMVMETDPAQKQLKVDAGVDMGGFPLGNILLYLEDDLLSFASPKYFDGEYGIHLKTLGKDFNASALSALLGMTLDDNFAYPLWPDEPGQSSYDYLGADSWLPVANKQLADQATVTKGSSQEVQVNDYPKTCDIYDIEVGGDSVVAYIRAVWDGLAGNEMFRNMMAIQMPYLTIDEILENMETALDELNGVFGTLTAKLYIKNHNLVRADLVLPFVDGDISDLLISIQIGGETNLMDAFTIDFSVDDVGAIIKWHGHHIPVAGKYDTTLTVHVLDPFEDDPILIMSMAGGYDTNLAENNVSLKLTIMPDAYEEVVFTMNGTLTVDKANNSYKLDFNDTLFESDYFSQQLALSFECMPLESPALAKRDPILFFSLSQSELQALIDEITGNFSALFGGMF